MSKNAGKHQTTLYLSTEDRETIREFCRRNQCTQQEMVARAIRMMDYIDLIQRQGGVVTAVRKDGDDETIRVF